MKNTIYDIVKNAARYSFAVLFILGVLQPFEIDKADRRLVLLFGLAVIEFVAMVIVQFITVPIKSTKWRIFTRYLLHMPLFSAMAVTFNSYFYFGSCKVLWTGQMNGGDPNALDLCCFLQMCLWVLLVTLLIAVYDIYYHRNSRLRQELEEVRAINALLEQRASRDEAESDEPVSVSSEEDGGEDAENSVCTIKGNAVNDLFEVSPKEILYIESLSNYADIWYLHEGERLHHIIRTTMKQLREQLAEVDYLISCHRAYIININYAVSLTSRTSGNYQLQMLGTDKLIPVSRANTVEIKRALQK